MIYVTPAEIEHLNEPERVKELIKYVYPDLIARHEHD